MSAFARRTDTKPGSLTIRTTGEFIAAKVDVWSLKKSEWAGRRLRETAPLVGSNPGSLRLLLPSDRSGPTRRGLHFLTFIITGIKAVIDWTISTNACPSVLIAFVMGYEFLLHTEHYTVHVVTL